MNMFTYMERLFFFKALEGLFTVQRVSHADVAVMEFAFDRHRKPGKVKEFRNIKLVDTLII